MSQAASFCLVADASCDLPASLVKHPQVRVMPIRLIMDGVETIDRRDYAVISDFYRNSLKSPKVADGHSEPMSINEMVAAIEQQIAALFDEGLGVFVSSARSAIYTRAKSAVASARVSTYMQRLKAGRTKPLQVDCVDSKSLFAGYTVQVLDLIDLVDQGKGITEIMARQQYTVDRTYAYVAPGDVAYILHRAARKGEKSVGALAAFGAKQLNITPIIRGHKGETGPVARKFGRAKAQAALFQLASNMIRQQLLESKHICFSYSGDLADISSQQDYLKLLDLAKRHHVKMYLEPLSITGAVNLGPDALALGVIAKDHDLDKLIA